MARLALDGFTLKKHPFYEDKIVVTYQATENSTGHRFALDFIKKNITTTEEQNAFEECCSCLSGCSYHPLFLHFDRGVLDNGMGVLIWRQPKGLMPMRTFLLERKDAIANKSACLRTLANIAQACRVMFELNIPFHGRLAIDNLLIDPIHEIPVLTRYGLTKLWLTLFKEKGMFPALICPPECAKFEDQMALCDKPEQGRLFDSFAFGSVMYQVFTGIVLDPKRPFDMSEIDKNIPGAKHLFVRETIRACMAADPMDRPQDPWPSHNATFSTLLQKKFNPVQLKTFCQQSADNGDNDAKPWIEAYCVKAKKPPLLHGVDQKSLRCAKPVPVSFIIGRKVFHNQEVFAEALRPCEPGRRILFINVFGGYQKGKSTTLYLLSGNKEYVLGSGTYETTRGVSIDGPYNLSDFDSVFRHVPGFPEDAFPLQSDPELQKEDPYIFLVDIEGYDGNMNGFDEETAKKLYRQLSQPFLALSSTVLFLADKQEGRTSRDFVADTLRLEDFSEMEAMSMIHLMMAVRNVESYSAMGNVLDYTDPWNKEQFKRACLQFQSQFGQSFQKNQKTAIDVNFYPLAPWTDRDNTTTIPRFDKSFIIMARSLLNTIYSMKSSTHVTDKVGAVESFARICSLFLPPKQLTTEEEARQAVEIQKAQRESYKTMLTQRFTQVKARVLETVGKEVEAAFHQFEANAETFKFEQLNEAVKQWLRKCDETYDRIVREDEKLAHDSDSFGICERIKYDTRNELEDRVSARQREFTKVVLKKHTEKYKCKMMKILPKLSTRLLRDVEHDLLHKDGWDYFVKHYKNIEKFASDLFATTMSDEGVLTSPEMQELAKEMPSEVLKWQVDYIDSVKESFITRVKEAFAYARICLAKMTKPKITQDGPDRKISGDKKYVERTIIEEWKAPDGTTIKEKRDMTCPVDKKCILI